MWLGGVIWDFSLRNDRKSIPMTAQWYGYLSNKNTNRHTNKEEVARCLWAPWRTFSWCRGLSCSAIELCWRITGVACLSRAALLTASYRLKKKKRRSGTFHRTLEPKKKKKRYRQLPKRIDLFQGQAS